MHARTSQYHAQFEGPLKLKITAKQKRSGLCIDTWFSKELKQLIRRKNRLFKKAHASGNSDHWKAYCLERNKTTAAIKRAKSVHFNNQVNTLSDPNCSPSRWWQVARDLCGLKRGVSSCVPPLLDSCGNVISEPVEKANLLNDVFANENTSLNPDASVFGPTNLQLTFNLEKITASEVRRVLTNKNTAKQIVMWK